MRAVLLVLALLPTLCSAGDWSFELLPPSEPSVLPGGSVGWGYLFTNKSASDWLLIDIVGFLKDDPEVMLSTSIFDYPLLAPGESRAGAYSPNDLGLFTLTWKSDAGLGREFFGEVFVSGSWWENDPFEGGEYLRASSEETRTFMSSVVPEPSAIVAVGVGIVAMLFRRKVPTK